MRSAAGKILTVRPRVVPAAQKSVLAAASFLSCQKEAAASFLSYFAAASFLPYFSDSLRWRDRRTRAGIV
jgi:hypothetical protein